MACTYKRWEGTHVWRLCVPEPAVVAGTPCNMLHRQNDSPLWTSLPASRATSATTAAANRSTSIQPGYLCDDTPHIARLLIGAGWW
jgi:hypothetical protein